MHPDRDFDVQAAPPWNEAGLVQDLELSTLLETMARGDPLVHDMARKALLTGCRNGPVTIEYRQAIVRDALGNPGMLRELYSLAEEVAESRRKSYLGIWSRHPGSVLYEAIQLMQAYVGTLRRLREIGRVHASRVSSAGFRSLFAMLEDELTDDYLHGVEQHLVELKFRQGLLLGAELGEGNVGRGYTLRRPRKDGRHWLLRLFSREPAAFTFRLPDRDEAGARALSELRDRGLDLVANALAQAVEHVEAFFRMLRAELAFHVGCLNLHEQLALLGEPTCFPRPLEAGGRQLNGRGLYDPCLALRMRRPVVGNALDAGGKDLVLITGANQGGKSSFLRSIGLAQLMMQSGMFVGAESFEGELCTGLFTHYRREEDSMLKGGKLDEELARMSEIADHLGPNATLLLNESFAATNEREGSEIARQVVTALLEKGIRVVFVTHLHAFARDLFERAPERSLFLRAERRPDGTRTFRLVEGKPLATSYGKDVYERVFAAGG